MSRSQPTKKKPHRNDEAFSLSRMTDLNPRPADYKSAALPTELIRRRTEYKSKSFLDSVQEIF